MGIPLLTLVNNRYTQSHRIRNALLVACRTLFSLNFKIHIFATNIKLRKIIFGPSLHCKLPFPPSKKMLLSVFYPLLPWARLKGLIKGKHLWTLVDGWTKTSQKAQWCIQLGGAERGPSCVKSCSFYSLLQWAAKTGNLQNPESSLKMAVFILNTSGRDCKHWLLWLLDLFLVLQPSINRTIERQS